MAKKFYTEKDIEDMFRSGILSLEVSDEVVLTELAYEKANRLGLRLVRDQPDNPPSAPVRPYITRLRGQPVAPPAGEPAASVPRRVDDSSPPAKDQEISVQDRIRIAVVARLGSQVDANLLDVIIKRVLNSAGMKEPTCCSAESGAQRCAPSSIAAPKG